MATYREINLELGQPAVADGLAHLRTALQTARRQNIKVIKFIHGYGSTGKGGKLRTATRKELLALHAQGQLRAVIKGEDFSIFSEPTRQALQASADLRGDIDLERHNNGITVVIL